MLLQSKYLLKLQALISTLLVSLCLATPLQAQDARQANAGDLVLKTTPTDTVIPLSGSVLFNTDGSIEAVPLDTSVCQATNSCEGVTVSISQFGFGSGTSSTQIEEGASTTVTWRAPGATSCVATGSYAPWSSRGNLLPDSRDEGTADKTIATSVGDFANTPFSIGLKCVNGSVEDTSTITLNLTEYQEPEPPSPTSCDGRDPPSGWAHSYGGRYVDWTQLTGWIGKTGNLLEATGNSGQVFTNQLVAKHYAAVRFTTTGMSTIDSGSISTNSLPAIYGKPAIVLTISKCAGDFYSQPSGCYWRIPGGFYDPPVAWRGENSSSSAVCTLEPNTTYYMNFAPTISPSGTAPNQLEPDVSCQGEYCGWLITPRG